MAMVVRPFRPFFAGFGWLLGAFVGYCVARYEDEPFRSSDVWFFVYAPLVMGLLLLSVASYRYYRKQQVSDQHK